MKTYHGSPELFKQVLENKIEELENNSVDSSTEITADSNSGNYMKDLMAGLRKALKGKKVNFAKSENAIYLVLTEDDKTVEYEIPYDDLSMNLENIDKDINMILAEVDKDNDARLENRDDVMSKVYRKLEDAGFDIEDDEVQNYADSAAELLMYGDQDVDQWWEDTQENYLDELLELPRVSRKM